MTLPLAYPDAELVVMAIHGHEPGNDSVGTWIPEDPQDGDIVVQRIGGGPDAEDQTDYALLRVLYYGGTRNEAMTHSREGESLMMAHRGRCIRRPEHPADGILVDYVAIEVNGTVDQDLDPDDRRITKNYTVGLRRQYQLVEA